LTWDLPGMNDEAFSYEAHFQRGVLLRGQRRFKEACDFFGKAIEADPEHAMAYAELALCFNDLDQRSSALKAINHAIALEPDNARLLGLKGWILVCQAWYREALEIANHAVAMDPYCLTALNAQANAFTKLGKWKEAEAVARRILTMQVNDAAALNLLAQSLRFQGRNKESREVVASLLALLPDNAFGHMNAGYSAMEVGDYRRANDHFLRSLQMDPDCELAREGLLHSMRARVWIYRWQFRASSFLRRPATFLRIVGLAAFVLAMIPLGFLLEALHPGLGSLLVLAWFAYIYLSVFSRINGDIFLLLDPQGQHALRLQDKIHAVIFALFLLLLMGIFAQKKLWVAFFTIVIYLGIFAFSIYYPNVRDRLQRRREQQEELAS